MVCAKFCYFHYEKLNQSYEHLYYFTHPVNHKKIYFHSKYIHKINKINSLYNKVHTMTKVIGSLAVVA